MIALLARIPWRLLGSAALLLGLVLAGRWVRDVLAERDQLRGQVAVETGRADGNAAAFARLQAEATRLAGLLADRERRLASLQAQSTDLRRGIENARDLDLPLPAGATAYLERLRDRAAQGRDP